jgi:hypothetical protein
MTCTYRLAVGEEDHCLLPIFICVFTRGPLHALACAHLRGLVQYPRTEYVKAHSMRISWSFQSNKGKTRPRRPYRRSQRLRSAGYSDIPIVKGRMEDSSRPSASTVVPPSQRHRQLASRGILSRQKKEPVLALVLKTSAQRSMGAFTSCWLRSSG